jgi:NTE family protein
MLNIFARGSQKRYKTGLVLSGGGTRGFAHLGVLKALDESGIRPDVISGVSAGAVVGALYADGNAPEEILELFIGMKLRKYVKLVFPSTGLLQMEGYEKVIRENLKAKNFEDLKMHLKVFAVNMNTAEYHCFEKGPISLALKASSSIPILFTPVKIGDHYFVDGGLINNFPVEALMGCCNRIIGVNVNLLTYKKQPKNLRRIAERSFHLAIRSHTKDRKQKCDLFIEPDGLEAYGMMELANAQKVFDLGYMSAIKALKEKGWFRK